MTRRRPGKSTASLAGWLFADLTLVLFVVSLSSAEGSAACPKPKKGRELPAWCTSSTTSPLTTTTSTTSTTTPTVPDTTIPPSPPPGIKPKPVEIVLESWTSRSLANSIEKKLADVYREDETLQSVGKLEEIRFGVIIVYGGSKDEKNSVGDGRAEAAEKVLTESWSRVEPTTYFETGHDQGIKAGWLNLKLFPVLGG